MTRIIFKEPHWDPLVWDMDASLPSLFELIGVDEDTAPLDAAVVTLGHPTDDLRCRGYECLCFFNLNPEHDCPNLILRDTRVSGNVVFILAPIGDVADVIDFERPVVDMLFEMIANGAPPEKKRAPSGILVSLMEQLMGRIEKKTD